MPKCEGFEIAYSTIDSECDNCRVKAQCKKATNYKLLNAKLQGGKPMENPTKEQLGKLLEAADKKKEVAMINKKFGYGCSLVKGMTIEEAKDLIMETAFPAAAEEEDGFELDETETDDFDDFEDSDDPDAAGAAAEETVEIETAAEDDLDDLKDSDLDDNPDADSAGDDIDQAASDEEDANNRAAAEAGSDTQDTPPGDMDEEEYDSIIGRIANMEKRLDDIYGILSGMKMPKGKAKAAAEAGSDLADEGEKLKAGMPYSEDDLKGMNAKIIKKLCKAIGINSFQKKVADLLPLILQYQEENCK